jgi:hypothetical protein
MWPILTASQPGALAAGALVWNQRGGLMSGVPLPQPKKWLTLAA